LTQAEAAMRDSKTGFSRLKRAQGALGVQSIREATSDIRNGCALARCVPAADRGDRKKRGDVESAAAE
jgi:hypothetical protein